MAVSFIKKIFKDYQVPGIDAKFLNELQNSIETNFSNIDRRVETLESDDSSTQTIDRYSIAETKTNATWTNGYNIYRKVFQIGTITRDEDDCRIDAAITNLKEVVNVYGGYKLNGEDKDFVPFNFYNRLLSRGSYAYYFNGKIIYGTDFNGKEAFVVVEYTKTTN